MYQDKNSLLKKMYQIIDNKRKDISKRFNLDYQNELIKNYNFDNKTNIPTVSQTDLNIKNYLTKNKKKN